MSRPAARDDRLPGVAVLDLAVEALLSAQLGDERGCRRALRELAGLARRWSGAPSLEDYAPPLRRGAEDEDDEDDDDEEDDRDDDEDARRRTPHTTSPSTSQEQP